MFHEFNIQVANRKQYTILLHDFARNSGQYFSSGFVMFPEGQKTNWGGCIFQDSGIETTKRLQISDVSEVYSRFNLCRSKL